MRREIWLCDDNYAMRQVLEAQLRKLAKENSDTFDIRCFSNGEDLLEAYTPDIRILLLDIEMGKDGLTGIETARRLRQISEDFFLIFITSHPEFALEGYEVHAFSYIQKPLVYGQLKRNMNLLFRKLDSQTAGDRSITIQDKSSSDVYRVDRILYCEVFRHDTRVVSLHGEHTYRVSLSSVEEKLQDVPYFYKCHKSYLVNLKYIARINGLEIVMRNGDTVPLSRHRKPDFMAYFARFTGGIL